MKVPFLVGAAAVGACCLTAWARPGGSGATLQRRTSQESPGGSRVPCAVPLRWRVARLDRDFGVSLAEARAAFEDAARVWERAARAQLFVRDSVGGFPIRFVYDRRQADVQEREALRDRLHAQEEAEARQKARLQDLERRVAEHNETVRGWNQLGGAPPGVAEDLRAAGVALAAERAELNERTHELDASRAALEAEPTGLDQRAGGPAERRSSTAPVQAGVYREAVFMKGDEVDRVSREIRIYRFASPRELRMVAAHELGHALGLGHVPAPGAIMSAEHDVGSEGDAPVEVKAADLASLRAACGRLLRDTH